MSLVKLDIETKFKWPEYDGDPLTQEENSKLMKLFWKQALSILNKTLSSFGLQECSGRVSIIADLRFRSEQPYIRLEDNPLFGVYKQADVEPALAQSGFSENGKTYLRMVVKNVISDRWIEFPFETIKTKFRECLSSNFFVIALSTVPLSDILGVSNHANMLVISKSRGTVYWIEPQGSPSYAESDYSQLMGKSIKKLVTDLGMADPTIVNPVTVCPQTISDDINCQFWSYIIFFLLMLNPREQDHNKLIQKFMQKYSTKEALTRYIDGFKRKMLEQISSSAGRRRHTHKRRVNKKRKTQRRL